MVCTLTGHGLKDPDAAIAQSTASVITVKADRDAVRDAITGDLA